MEALPSLLSGRNSSRINATFFSFSKSSRLQRDQDVFDQFLVFYGCFGREHLDIEYPKGLLPSCRIPIVGLCVQHRTSRNFRNHGSWYACSTAETTNGTRSPPRCAEALRFGINLLLSNWIWRRHLFRVYLSCFAFQLPLSGRPLSRPSRFQLWVVHYFFQCLIILYI